MTTTNRYRLVELNFGLQTNDNTLEIINHNMNSFMNFTKGTELVFTFNDAITEGNTFSNIRITTETGAIVPITRRVNFNQVILTITKDLANVQSLNILFPTNSVNGKFSSQMNKTVYTIEILDPININKFDIIEENVDIYAGQEYTLNSQIQIGDEMFVNNSEKSKYILWESSNPNVAFIENGIIYAYKPGKVTIIGKTFDGKLVDSVEVNIKRKVSQIITDYELIVVKIGEEKQITYSYNPMDATDLLFTYQSSDESVVTISEDGIIKALKKGTSIITISCHDVNKYIYVSVVDENYEDVEIIKIDSYDLEAHTITFKTKSFSNFAIAIGAGAPNTGVITNDSGFAKTNIYVTVLCTIVTSVVAVVIYRYRSAHKP
jgi:hypothetical protein